MRLSLRDGPDGRLTVLLQGEQVEVTTGEPVVRPVVARTPMLPRPPQPAGRAPAPHG